VGISGILNNVSTRTPYGTAGYYARIYHVPLGTIYRWASTDGWRRTPAARRPVRYHPDDADRSYQRYRESDPA
jgi:hypothetical protein